jgi:hypothetical protein
MVSTVELQHFKMNWDPRIFDKIVYFITCTKYNNGFLNITEKLVLIFKEQHHSTF